MLQDYSIGVFKKLKRMEILSSMGFHNVKIGLISILFYYLQLLNYVKSEDIFTSMADIQNLLYSKKECLSMLNEYIIDEEQRLQKIRDFIKDHENLKNDDETDVEYYLGNPINAFLLIKSLTKDWKHLGTIMRHNASEIYINKIESNVFLPGDDDLNGAAVALFRLQDMYKVDTNKMAGGDISGVKTSPNLNAEQCFEIGRQSYLNEDFYHTRIWMEEALRKWDVEQDKTIKREDILEYLAFSLYKQGNVNMALKKTDELLELNPSHSRAQGNKEWYQKDLDELEKSGKKGDEMEKVNADDEYNSPEQMNYHSLCRGDYPRDTSIQKKLKCRYVNRYNSPALKVSPAKEETLNYKPWIVIYHDVLNDQEVKIVKELAYPRLKRATTFNSKTQKYEPADYRISKSAWLREEDHKVIVDINRRISTITGLSMETAEDLQVANYGIGGHYDPHYDFSRNDEYDDDGNYIDKRIATWMFYMSDVVAGGATVFPLVGVRSTPKKGSAAFWYNLKASGNGDFDTRHAACPVLAGSKWVSNKWIHERGQEFRRPCKLNPSL
ncbi:unnamed protein product [Gordionus sp. m RMFG-2023]